MKSRLVLSIVILTALVAGTAPARSQSEPAGQVRLLSAGSGEIRFRVDFDAPLWTEETDEAAAYRYPQWPGLETDGEPGAPALPVMQVRVAVPPEGDVRLSHDAVERASAEGVRFPPAPRAEAIEPLPDRRVEISPQWTRTEGEAYGNAAGAPRVELLSIGVERGVRVATVAVRPARWNPATGRASWSRSVSVSVATDGFGARGDLGLPLRRGRPDPTAEEDWLRTLVNPEDAAGLRVAAEDAPAPPDFDSLTWFDDADGWAKIRIEANGVYALDRATLAAAGVPVDEIDPSTLRLFSGPLVPDVAWADLGWEDLSGGMGTNLIPRWLHVYDKPAFSGGFTGGGFEEIAVEVTGATDGSFDASDRLVFYGLGPDNYRDRFGLPLDTAEDYFVNPYAGYTVYWLAWGGDLPGTPRRMATVDATPQAGAEVLTSSRARLHAESNTLYDPSMYEPGLRWEVWFWERISSNSAGNLFEVRLPDLVPDTELGMHLRVWGYAIPLRGGSGEEGMHHLNVTVNGENVGLYSWGGSEYTNAFTPYDVKADGLPAESTTGIVLSSPKVGTSELREDIIELAWMDVDYERVLDAGGAPAEFRVDAGATANRTVRVADAPAGTPVAYDVTDFRTPRRLNGVRRLTDGSGDVEFAAGRSDGFMVAVTDEQNLRTPASVAKDTPPRLRPSTGTVSWLREVDEPVDYVIVAFDELASEGEILAGWRRGHLPPITDTRTANVRVVRISDIMDEFAWGMWDPSALRYFLEYAYRYYGGPEDAPLSYALFLGDHTFDYRNHYETGLVDMVPSWDFNHGPISGIIHGNVQYTTDDYLARFDGPQDLLTDLYLGRISVQTRAEAQAVISGKVVPAEQDPLYGAWRTKAILVADDRCQGRDPDASAWTHLPISEGVDARIPDVFDRSKVYLFEYGEECIYDSKPDAKRALLDTWSEGAWLVNYVGHGGPTVLADEHVLDLADTPLLANDRRLPVFGAFSCSVGKFSNPNQEGLGEGLLREPGGGSLVSAAATHLTYTGNNEKLNHIFIQQLFSGGSPTDPTPVGVALMRAKRLWTPDNDKYACLGDPASRLNVPDHDLELTGPGELERAATLTVDARLPGDGMRDGTMDVVARDARFHRTKDAQGRELGSSFSYYLPGAMLFRGRTLVQADTASASFTVPLSLRGGPDGKVRTYGWGTDWDAVGALTPLPVTLQTAAITDTVGPAVSFSFSGDLVRGGEEVVVTLEDPAGINLTRIFDFLAIGLKVFDENGLEQLRLDLTDRFQYDTGSHTRGALAFTVPDLSPGAYTFLLTATDNYNNRSQAALELNVLAGTTELRFENVFAYPNPFDPEAAPTRLMFTMNRPAEVTVRVYSVAGRLVRKAELSAAVGLNRFDWDGRDRVGDVVANGVYLVQLSGRGTQGGGTARHLERLVVLR